MDKWMVKVCPFEDVDCFVQRGKLCDSPEEAEEERKEWAPSYARSKVVKCREIDIKMYERFSE